MRFRPVSTSDASREDVVRILKDIRSRPRRKVHEVDGLRISWTSVRAPRRAFNPVIIIERDGVSFTGSFDEAVDRLVSFLRKNVGLKTGL